MQSIPFYDVIEYFVAKNFSQNPDILFLPFYKRRNRSVPYNNAPDLLEKHLLKHIPAKTP